MEINRDINQENFPTTQQITKSPPKRKGERRERHLKECKMNTISTLELVTRSCAFCLSWRASCNELLNPLALSKNPLFWSFCIPHLSLKIRDCRGQVCCKGHPGTWETTQLTCSDARLLVYPSALPLGLGIWAREILCIVVESKRYVWNRT